MKHSDCLMQGSAPYLPPCCTVVELSVRSFICGSYRTGSDLPDAEEESWGTL